MEAGPRQQNKNTHEKKVEQSTDFDAGFLNLQAEISKEVSDLQATLINVSEKETTNKNEVVNAQSGYAGALTRGIRKLNEFLVSIPSSNSYKTLRENVSKNIIKLSGELKDSGLSPRDAINNALEKTPEKKLDKIKKELEKNGDGLNALYIEIAKKIKDKDGVGKLSDEEKSYYTLKLKNYKAEVTTQSIEMAALTASGPSIRADLINLVEDNIKSLYNGSNSGDLVSKITDLMDKTRDGFTSPDKKLDGVVEKMEGINLALVTLEAEIKAKIADPATIGGLTPVQKRLFYIRALNQKSTLVKQKKEIESLLSSGYNNDTQLGLVRAYEITIDSMFQSIENSLTKKKELDLEKDLKIVDIKISNASKHFQDANSLTKGYAEANENKLTFLQALKMRVAGKSNKEVGKEQVDRGPVKKMRRSDIRQALNGYKKAYRDLYFAFEKIEKLYHSDSYEKLSTEDRERVYQKMKEIKEEQKLINDTVGALGDALPAFARGSLKGERFTNWIGYKWSKKPEAVEKSEPDWKGELPPLVDTITPFLSSAQTSTGPARPTEIQKVEAGLQKKEALAELNKDPDWKYVITNGKTTKIIFDEIVRKTVTGEALTFKEEEIAKLIAAELSDALRKIHNDKRSTGLGKIEESTFNQAKDMISILFKTAKIFTGVNSVNAMKISTAEGFKVFDLINKTCVKIERKESVSLSDVDTCLNELIKIKNRISQSDSVKNPELELLLTTFMSIKNLINKNKTPAPPTVPVAPSGFSVSGPLFTAPTP